jgi:hypothetical protein
MIGQRICLSTLKVATLHMDVLLGPLSSQGGTLGLIEKSISLLKLTSGNPQM